MNKIVCRKGAKTQKNKGSKIGEFNSQSVFFAPSRLCGEQSYETHPRLILTLPPRAARAAQDPFEAISPDVDETPQPNEAPEKLVERLARAKARKVAADHRDALVIGSDQVAVYNGKIVGKPHGHDKAVAQLKRPQAAR